MQVSEVMSGPGGQELAEGDLAEGWMKGLTLQVKWLQIPAFDFSDVGGADYSEGAKKFCQRLVLVFFTAGATSEGWKGARLGAFADGACAGEPVGVLAIDQMRDDFAGSPRAAPLVAIYPCGGKWAKQCLQRRRRLGEQRESIREYWLCGLCVIHVKGCLSHLDFIDAGACNRIWALRCFC